MSQNVEHNISFSGMKGKIIGTIGPFSNKGENPFSHVIIYLRNNTIEYCRRVWSYTKPSKIEMIANAIEETVS